MPHNPETYMAQRYKKGTPEYLWHKWYNKLWKAYSHHSQSTRTEPPSFMRDEFLRDMKIMVESRLAILLAQKENEDDE